MVDQLGFTFQAPRTFGARRIWRVQELLSSVRTAVEREYTDLWVEGEISNFRPAESGHLYFTLKDGDAQLRVVMFRLRANLLRFKPENGLQVIARGRVTIYEQRGELQLSAEYLEPKGAGALQLAFEQLKARLAGEGLFDPARKKPIPALPRRIGIVTSPRGAAIQDMLNVLRRRHETASILIFPAQVQGEGAVQELRAGIGYFNRSRNVDVIILARGGGSPEDLVAFNHEELARAIAASQVPIISAVGHETDFTIADFVADLRAPTPSAAAELVIESKRQLEWRVSEFAQRLGRAARYRLLVARQQLMALARHGAFARMADALARRQQRVDELIYRLATAQVGLLGRFRRRLDVASARVRPSDLRRLLAATRREVEARGDRLAAALRRHLLGQRARLEQAAGRLEALSPISILGRGYALVFDAAGKLVKESAQVELGSEITARLARGTLTARVQRKT